MSATVTAVAAPEGCLTWAEVLEAVDGLTPRQLEYWSRSGYVITLDAAGRMPVHNNYRGELQDGPGSGYRRFWRQQDMLTLRRVITLVQLGVRARDAFAIARGDADAPGVRVVFEGDLA